MKLDRIPITINQNAVFQMIDCRKESPVYDAVMEAYEELLPEVLRCAEGSCLLGLGELREEDASEDYPAGTRVIYVISTVGKALSELSGRLFEEGEFLKGMLADAMADSALFEMEKQWMFGLRKFCGSSGVGIRARLEAPQHLPMTVQKTAFEVLEAAKHLGISITSGMMYDPLKSSCLVFAVSEDSCQFEAEHDCSRCPAIHCRLRKADENVEG